MANRIVVEDLIGQQFGLWTVIELQPDSTGWDRQVICSCQCGTTKPVRVSSIVGGKSKCCGCKSNGRSKSKKPTNAIQHGMSRTPTYQSYYSMLARCLNPKAHAFDKYGGRGIQVCDKWVSSFQSFLSDMGARPSMKHSLGRINNDGHYCPENCRWEDDVQQQNNTSQNHFIEVDGDRLTIAQWSRKTGIKMSTIRYRIKKGWPAKEAVSADLVQKKDSRCRSRA